MVDIELEQYPVSRGSKSRNKVTVGEPAVGSFTERIPVLEKGHPFPSARCGVGRSDWRPCETPPGREQPTFFGGDHLVEWVAGKSH